MKRGAILAVLAVLMLAAHGQAEPIVFTPHIPDQDELIKGYCSRVIDGDTAWFEIVEDGVSVTHTYRLIGVDTPETVHPDRGAEPYGPEASAFTTASLQDKWVYLEYDLEKTDAYDRHLAYVWLEGGTLFNLVLLEKGYGKFLVIAPNIKYSAHLVYAQKAAQSNQVGIWSPLPEVVLAVDLEGMTVTELMLLQKRIADEIQLRDAK